jgi:hypothetical protein
MHRRFCCVRGGRSREAETSPVPEPQRGLTIAQRLFRRKTVTSQGLGWLYWGPQRSLISCAGFWCRRPKPRGIPIATPQALILTDLPVAPGPRISLFNGIDLNEWDGWLGYPDPAETSTEFDMLSGELGKLVPVGRGLSAKTTIGCDPDLFNQRRRFVIGGREVDVTGFGVVVCPERHRSGKAGG